MEIILLEHLTGLGRMGEKVSVKPGFARNFLLPQGKALPASPANMAKYEAQKAELEKEMKAKKAEADKVAAKLDGVKVTLKRPASETGQLYGSVKPRDIAVELEAQGVAVQKSAVQIGQPIKEIGEHEVKVALHAEVIVPLALEVARQSS